MSESTPHSALSPDEAQLELFPDDVRPGADAPGLTSAQARASISPGWWALVEPLYHWRPDEITVDVCREVDGALELHATASLEPDSLERVLRRIRAAASRTCGCCGADRAGPYRPEFDTPTRVVCSRCRERLVAGESYLTIADDFWRLDGSRRAQPRAPLIAVLRRPAADRPGAPPLGDPLPPDELRRVIGEIRNVMRAEIVGHDAAIARLALLGGLHVGGGLPRGGRALLLGPSGVGKTALIAALEHALAPWDLPWVRTDALDLTSPGWSGAPTLGGLVAVALRRDAPDSPRARHAVVVIDELHHARLVRDTTGNTAVKRAEVLGSLLGLAGHGTLHLGEGPQAWSSRQALVIGLGAFTGLLNLRRSITVRDLVAAGLPLEFTTRLAEDLIVLEPLREPELIALLRRWPALTSLVEVCTRLGYPVRIADEAYARAARAVWLGHDGSTARTAGGWIVSALRQSLIATLEHPEVTELHISPDSLPIPSTTTRQSRTDDPPDGSADWDSPSNSPR